MTQTLATLLVIGMVLMTGCNREQSTVAPSPVPTTAAPSTPAAPPASDVSSSVYVQSPQVLRELVEGDTDAYYTTFELRESGGGPATVKAVDLSFSNGVTATFGPEVASSVRIPTGGSVTLSNMTVTGNANTRAHSVQIRVLVSTDKSGDMVSLAATGVTPTYVLSGSVRDAANKRAIAGAVVTITFGRATGRTATSDSAGRFSIRTVPNGTVSFTVAAPDYATVTRTADVFANAVADVELTRAS